MVDVLTKKQRSYNMAQIKAKHTKAEINLRKALSSKGIRGYSLHFSKLTGKPDLIFRKYKIIIFIDGCFWHKCPKCFVEPQTRNKFWMKKINNNVKRAKKVNKILKKEGWKVLRFWEHQIKKNPEKCYSRVYEELVRKGFKG